jgi:hypothetical protein
MPQFQRELLEPHMVYGYVCDRLGCEEFYLGSTPRGWIKIEYQQVPNYDRRCHQFCGPADVAAYFASLAP